MTDTNDGTLHFSGLAYVDTDGHVFLGTAFERAADLNKRVLEVALALTGMRPPGYLQVELSLEMRLPPERVQMGFGKPQVVDEQPSAVTAEDWAKLRERLTPSQQRLVQEMPRYSTIPPAPAEARSEPTSAQKIIRMLRENRAHVEPGFGPSGDVTELSVVPGAYVPSCDADHPYLADLSCDLPKGHTGEHRSDLSATLAAWE